MGGPHVTEVPDEALGTGRRTAPCRRGRAGRSGRNVAEDRRGCRARPTARRSIHRSMNSGRSASRPCRTIRRFRGTRSTWTSSTSCRSSSRRCSRSSGSGWETFHIIPDRVRPRLSVRLRVLHGDRIFRRLDPLSDATRASSTNAACSRRARRSTRGQIAVFFVDDNFAINVKRTKSLLRDIIAADAQCPLGGANQRQPVA